MLCPKCGSATHHVVDVRPHDTYTYRRLSCVRCTHRWKTYELTMSTKELNSILKNGITALSKVHRENYLLGKKIEYLKERNNIIIKKRIAKLKRLIGNLAIDLEDLIDD